jgi:hypothetical protein
MATAELLFAIRIERDEIGIEVSGEPTDQPPYVAEAKLG